MLLAIQSYLTGYTMVISVNRICLMSPFLVSSMISSTTELVCSDSVMAHLTESFQGERLAGISINASWRETPEVRNFSEWRIVTWLSFNNADAFKPAGADRNCTNLGFGI
jgi:hypothetical protein